MQFIDAIVCDDIRREINNKLSLMGIYNDKMVLHIDSATHTKFPLHMNLSLLLRFKLDQNEKQPDYFEFEYLLNNNNINKVNGEFSEKNNKGQLNLVIATVIPIEPGDLGFIIKLYSKGKLLLMEEQRELIKITAEDGR